MTDTIIPLLLVGILLISILPLVALCLRLAWQILIGKTDV